MPKNVTMPKTYQSLQKINVLAWPGLAWLGLACHNSKKIDTNRAPAAAFGRRPLFGLFFCCCDRPSQARPSQNIKVWVMFR